MISTPAAPVSVNPAVGGANSKVLAAARLQGWSLWEEARGYPVLAPVDPQQDPAEPLSQACGTSRKAYLRKGRKCHREEEGTPRSEEEREEVLQVPEQILTITAWERPKLEQVDTPQGNHGTWRACARADFFPEGLQPAGSPGQSRQITWEGRSSRKKQPHTDCNLPAPVPRGQGHWSLGHRIGLKPGKGGRKKVLLSCLSFCFLPSDSILNSNKLNSFS